MSQGCHKDSCHTHATCRYSVHFENNILGRTECILLFATCKPCVMSVNIKCPGHPLLAFLTSHVLTFSPYFLICLCVLSWLFHNLTSLWGLLLSCTFSLLILALQVTIFIAKILCIGDPQFICLTSNTPFGPVLHTHLPVCHLYVGASKVSQI